MDFKTSSDLYLHANKRVVFFLQKSCLFTARYDMILKQFNVLLGIKESKYPVS